MKREKTCLICNTKCIGCAGGKCRGCSFSEAQVAVSNHFVRSGLNIGDKDLVQKLKELVRDNKSIKEITEILGFTPEEIVEDEIVVPATVENSEPIAIPLKELKSMRCVYGRGVVNAWDTCKYCGESRFYGQGKKCKFLLEKNNELQTN